MKKILTWLKSFFKPSNKERKPDKCFKCRELISGPALYKKTELRTGKIDYRWFHTSCERPAPINLYQASLVEDKGFMKDDAKWKADIKARKMTPDGKVARYTPDGERYA